MGHPLKLRLDEGYFSRSDARVFLIGKDGGLKASDQDLDLPTLFARIDAMTDAPLALTRSASAWDSPAFRPTLVEEIQALGSHHPALHPLLQAGLTQTSAVAEAPLGVQVLRCHEGAGLIHVHLGVVYAGIIAGCSCADDPSPVDTITERCELLLDIDPGTGRAWMTPCDE